LKIRRLILNQTVANIRRTDFVKKIDRISIYAKNSGKISLISRCVNCIWNSKNICSSLQFDNVLLHDLKLIIDLFLSLHLRKIYFFVESKSDFAVWTKLHIYLPISFRFTFILHIKYTNRLNRYESQINFWSPVSCCNFNNSLWLKPIG
jgi:hypothetical protein